MSKSEVFYKSNFSREVASALASLQAMDALRASIRAARRERDAGLAMMHHQLGEMAGMPTPEGWHNGWACPGAEMRPVHFMLADAAMKRYYSAGEKQ